MRNTHNRTALLILLVLLTLSVIMRYPLVEHERLQTDSYFIHLLGSSVVENGYGAWLLHPLSYVGYYPFSYPSGAPFVLAEVSLLTGVNMELSVLMTNMFFGIIFCLAAFMLSRHFLLKIEFVLLAVFFIIVGARFVDTSYWDASARSPLVVLMVLSVSASLHLTRRSDKRMMIVVIFLAIGCFVLHHMAVLLIIFAIGYLIASLQVAYIIPRIRLRKKIVLVSVNSAILLFVALVSIYVMGFAERFSVSESFFQIEPGWLSGILDMAVSYTNQIGFIIVAAAFGLPGLLLSRRSARSNLFLLAMVIVFVSLLWNSLYVSMVLGPFVAIIGVSWLDRRLARAKRRALALTVLSILVISSAALPILSSARWNDQTYISGDTIEVDSQFFADAAYIRVMYDDYPSISNTNVMTIQLSATTSTVFLGSGLLLALSGEITSEDVSENLTWSSARFPINLYVWFEHLYDPKIDNYILGMMINGVGYVSSMGGYPPARDYFSQYPALLVVVDADWPKNAVTQYGILPSTLTVQLHEAQYKRYPVTGSEPISLESYALYASEGITMYALKLP